MATDFTKPALQILVDLINATNGTSLTLTDIDFSACAATGGGNRNTGVTITAKPNTGYTGHRDLTYDRVDLASIPGSRSKVFQLGSAVSAKDLLPALNAAYGLNLTTDDIIDDPMPTFTGGDPAEQEPFTLRAKATSYIYRGSVVLTMDANDVDLQNLITTTELNGLFYPAV